MVVVTLFAILSQVHSPTRALLTAAGEEGREHCFLSP
jgi:hypothetical protein